MKHVVKYSDWQESDGYTNVNSCSSAVKKPFHCPVCGSHISITSKAVKRATVQDSQDSIKISSR